MSTSHATPPPAPPRPPAAYSVQPAPAPESKQEILHVVLTDVRIPFMRMIGIIWTITIAASIAVSLLMIVDAIFMRLLWELFKFRR